MFLHALSGADEARKRYAESGRQAFPRQSFSGADESRKRYAVAGLGEFRALRSAGTVSKRIDTPYGGFYPLGTPSSALLGYLGATERKRSYLEVGPKKENGSTVTGS